MAEWRPEDTTQLIEELATFANDPLGFVQFVYPWGEKNTPLEYVTGPRRWQAEALTDIGDHTKRQEFNLANGLDLSVYQEATASGRGIGKSALFAMLTNWQLSSHPGAGALLTANTEGQLKTKTFPEIGRWNSLALNGYWWNVESLKMSPQPWLAELVDKQLHISPKQWAATGVPWSQENPDAYAGEHNPYGLSVFFDEASGIPDQIWTVTHGFFTELTAYRQWIAFSQGRNNSGPFYDRFHKEAYRKFWKTRQIDARTVEGSDQSVFNEMIATHGIDSDKVLVEVLGQFPEAGEDQFITASSVRAAQKRPPPEHIDWTENLVMGVDPAPRGRTAIRFRAGRDGRTLPAVILQNKNNIQISNTVMALARKYKVDAVVIDQGMGTGVIDYLREKHFHRMVPMYCVLFGSSKTQKPEWATVGTEIWARMRDWLALDGMIDESEELKRDLISRLWKWSGREDNKKILEPKKDLEKRGIPSPDDADALALTFYPRLPPKDARLRGASGNTRVAAGTESAYGF